MAHPSKTFCGDITTAPIKLEAGWRAVVSLEVPGAGRLSPADWAKALAGPQTLVEIPGRVLKEQGRHRVVAATVTVGGRPIEAVVKHHSYGPDLPDLFRRLQPPKAGRNFKTAVKLLAAGIPAAFPLAAIWRRRFFFVTQSIYLTLHIGGGCTLYDLAAGRPSAAAAAGSVNGPAGPAARRRLCRDLAVILSGLHRNGLYHRDSKASNFIVRRGKNGFLDVILVDLDGIKHHRRRRRRSCRSLWRLAASLLSVRRVSRTDYLRTFVCYCNLAGVEQPARRRLYRVLAGRAGARHERSMAKAAARSDYVRTP
jgi:hypothetical protein